MEDAIRIAQLVIAVGAIAAVFVGWIQARITRNMAADQHRMLQEDLKTRLLLHYEDRFESRDMLAYRRDLANRLLEFGNYRVEQPIANDQLDIIGDRVPAFFESLATMVRRGNLDVEMAWVVFGYHARHYWVALASYVREDRRRRGEHQWEEFANLVAEIEQWRREKSDRSITPIDEQSTVDFLRQETHAGN